MTAMRFPSPKKMTLIAGAIVAINGFFPRSGSCSPRSRPRAS